MELIFSFKNNNKEYVIYQKDNKYYGGIKNNNEVKDNMSISEKILINYVFNKIKVGNNLIKLGTLKVNNVDYNHLIDVKNGWNIFTRLDNKKLSKDEIKYFNINFNHQEECVCFNLSYNNSEIIKRIVTFGKKTIVVFLTANCLITNAGIIENIDRNELDSKENIELAINEILENDNHVDEEVIIIKDDADNSKIEIVQENLNQKQELIIEDIEEKSVDIPQDNNKKIENVYQINDDTILLDIDFKNDRVNKIKNALISNTNLSNNEKNFILNNFDIVVDNIDYIDIDYLIDCYSNLIINYNKEMVKSLDKSQEDEGQLVIDIVNHEYVINVSNASKFEEVNQMVLLHELSHTLEGGKYDYRYSYLTESLNSIYNSEYFGVRYSNNYKDYDYSYSELKPYIYALSEVFGADMFRRFHFTQDINCIREEMKKTILTTHSGLSEEVYNEVQQDNLIYALNTLSKRITLNPELEQYQKQVANDFYNVLSEYYMAIYGESMENNFEIMLQLKPEAIINGLNIETLPESVSKRLEIVEQKAYFNNNNSNYMKASKVNYFEIYRNGVDVISLEDAINSNLIKENNGQYEIIDDKVIKVETGNVFINTPYGQKIIELNEEDLKFEEEVPIMK